MSIKTSFIGELKSESANTKKILEKVPLEKAGWKPHEKSMSIGRLATHIAETSHWIFRILEADEFDFAANAFTPRVAKSTEELMEIFNTNISKSIAALENASDDDLEKNWTLKRGEHIVFSIPKKVAIRGWGFNHTVHHRGQLSVYLRLLDIAVPGMYGPSA
ncbi:MAG: DinB family protein, partial [Bacteroidetes bacterium]|nr:DinB family protein [Bacteroidota bacterium]